MYYQLSKKNAHANGVMSVIFFSIILLYALVIVGMYSEENLNIFIELTNSKLSPELMSGLGFNLTQYTLTGFITTYFYSMLMIVFPMVYYIMLSNRLVVDMVDKGSMASILSTPITRVKFVFVQLLFQLKMIILFIALTTVIIILYCQIKFPGELDSIIILKINLQLLMLHFALSSICFYFSCRYNESKNYMAFGIGVPVTFYLIDMAYKISSDIEVLKYCTIFSLYSPTKILEGESQIVQIVILACITAIFSLLSVKTFNKKDLPI